MTAAESPGSSESALVWTLIASLFLGNLMLLVLNLPLVGIWVKLLRIPRPYLYAGAWCSPRSARTR